MKAKDFLELDGYWNGKLYSQNRVFKNNVQYTIDDPENLTIEKLEKNNFGSYLDSVTSKIDCLIEAYNSLSGPEKRRLIKGSNRKSETVGDPYQQRFRLKNNIERLQLLLKRIEAENE